MSPALPGTRGLFSVLQEALSRGNRRHMRLNQHVDNLVDSLWGRPTRFLELVPTPPMAVGASDACQVGMGGVWFDASATQLPLLWRQRFAPHVSAAMITYANPTGSLPISDLELTAIIAHKDVRVNAWDARERIIWIGSSDNKAVISWSTKGTSSTSLATRGYLLR